MVQATPIEVRIAGFGGQGVILEGMILGRAASIFENKHATLIQSFGPEARGGACSAQVMLSEERILYPYVKEPDILVAMSQEALTRYLPTLKAAGKLIYERDLVEVSELLRFVREYGPCVVRRNGREYQRGAKVARQGALF